MSYNHPKPGFKLSKQERTDLLKDYLLFCTRQAAGDPTFLNRKVPREAFRALHDQVGVLLLDEAKRLVGQPGLMREFIDANPLPERMKPFLPDDYRIFCLVLNSLKQWAVSELATTDRYLLGSRVREECRAIADHCVLSGDKFTGQPTELHHPVRDGRPPILLTKTAHARLEGQMVAAGGDPVGTQLRAARRRLNRSWVFIRLGCQALLGEVPNKTPRAPAAMSTVRRICTETGLSAGEIAAWIKTNVA